MNKSNNEVFLKKNIVMYAKKVRDIQRDQIDPYVDLIEKSLAELYPSLVNRDDGVPNWACDIVSAASNTEVIETLGRIEDILQREVEENWVCCVCGENTYNVDIDNLIGKDHISCLLSKETKEKELFESKDSVKKQLESLKVYVKQLEETISNLESHYDEPTN